MLSHKYHYFHTDIPPRGVGGWQGGLSSYDKPADKQRRKIFVRQNKQPI